MGYLADGAFFTLRPRLPALSAPKPKRKYKRRSNLSMSATMRDNTSGDTTNSIIRYHVVQLVLSWTNHMTPEFTQPARRLGLGQEDRVLPRNPGIRNVNYPVPKFYLSKE